MGGKGGEYGGGEGCCGCVSVCLGMGGGGMGVARGDVGWGRNGECGSPTENVALTRRDRVKEVEVAFQQSVPAAAAKSRPRA